jgi:hypothetical protein
MKLSNAGCRTLLNQIGKRRFSIANYVCRYTKGETICVGMPEDYFEFICNTLCLICRNSRDNTFEYENCVCSNYQETNLPRRLFYEFDIKYNPLCSPLKDDDSIVEPWFNPELSLFLEICNYLENFGFDTNKKKFILSFYAFLLYNCETGFITENWDDWKEILSQIRKDIVNLSCFINRNDWENKMDIVFDKYISSADGVQKEILEDFSSIFKRMLKPLDKDYIKVRMTKWV